jgi:hypothetical protein
LLGDYESLGMWLGWERQENTYRNWKGNFLGIIHT